MKLFDTSPNPRFLRALQNQRWTASGAISELVDNSFGEGRGNANTVRITWDATHHVLTVLDNGNGMDALHRLFKLGDTVGRSPGDIGEYGAGGTWALIWLARSVSVWTMRDGKTAHAAVDWDEQIARDAFAEIDDSWRLASASNTPTELLEEGHGTLIRLHIPAKRKIHVGNVQKDLARSYGPALRYGRRLVWQTVGRGSTGEIKELHDLMQIPDPREFLIEFELDGQTLVAHGQAGVVENGTVSQSGMAICFGPRLLTLTKDCFKAPDGELFAGIGLMGYADLMDGWRGFLSTTKSSVDDDRAWDLLMAGLFKFLRPMLDELEQTRRKLLFDDLALELKDLFNGALKVKVDEGGRLEPDSEGQERMGRMRKGPQTESKPAQPASRQQGAGVEIDLVDASDLEMEGLLCRIDVEGESMLGFINSEHPFVQDAISDVPPNRRALHKMVVDAIAARIVENRSLLEKILPPASLQKLESFPEQCLRHGWLVRTLIDKVKDESAA